MTEARLISGPLQTERRSDGRRRLLRDVEVEAGEIRVRVPVDTVTDFSSIPWFARFIVRWSKVDVAGVVHDRLYQTGEMNRARADAMWRVVACSGEHRANPLQAWTCWFGLRLFGWIAWDGHRRRDTRTSLAV